jgi:dihydroxyacetone kinase
MEVGLGVHGEAGVGRVPLASAHDAVARLLDHMTNPGILSIYNSVKHKVRFTSMQEP